MTPQNKTLVKYIGPMFSSLIGGFLGEVQNIAAAYGGDIKGMMRDLSGSPYFTNTLVAGSPRDIAQDLVNRIAGNTAAAADREWAVDWMVGSHNAGLTWGEIIYEAISALDGITSGAWAATADAMRARTEYNIAATEGWAWNITNLDTLRDVYSAAVTPAGFTPSAGDPAAIDQLLAANGALATAAAGLTGQAAGSSYTFTSADAGRAIMMGDGDDTATIGFGNLDKLVLLSGGAGNDTLIVTNTGATTDFATKYGGLFGDQPIRGFENIVFQGLTPPYFGSVAGTREITLGGYGTGFETTLVGIENGTKVNLLVDDTAYLKFSDVGRYNNSGPVSVAPPPVEKLSLNVQAGGAGTAFLSAPPAKDLNVAVNAPAGSTFSWTHHASAGGTFAAVAMPHLEHYTVSSSVSASLNLTAPNVRSVDLSGSTGVIRLQMDGTGGPLRTDGFHDAINVSASQSALAFSWINQSPYADSTVNFVGEFKAGSQLAFKNADSNLAKDMPFTRAVFGSDFSQSGALKAANLSDRAGSIFDVTGVEFAAVYFKGVAPSGQDLGTVSIGNRQTTFIKVDSAQGLNMEVSGSGLGVVINDGAGSVLDKVRASVEAQVGAPLNIMNVAGGRILWADLDGSGQLSGQTVTDPWKLTPDLVIMETSSANYATMSQSIVAMGFNPLFDPFMM